MKLSGKMKKMAGRRALTAAVMAWLAAAPLTAAAHTMEYVYSDGAPFAEMTFLDKDESFLFVEGRYYTTPGYQLDRELIDATKSSTAYWTGILGPRAKNGQPWQVFVTTQANYQNASASTLSWQSHGQGPLDFYQDNLVMKLIEEGRPLQKVTVENAIEGQMPAGDYGVSVITIGQHMGANRDGAIDGWWIDTDTVLPTNEQATDFVGAFRHELGHALGISIERQYFDAAGNVTDDYEKGARNRWGESLVRFHENLVDPDEWNLHLVDQNLNPAKPGMEIVSTAYFKVLKAKNPTLRESDFFIVDNPKLDKNLTGAQGSAYFVGDHVTEVLDGATFNGVSGLPVNGWEAVEIVDDKYYLFDFEGSHLQTTGMMSHRRYSNYTSFMEVELAVMQDLGYDFDRKAYFGYSVYGDGGTITNTHGYFARNEDGTAYLENTYSAVPLGIGLHIYGSKNTVTQAANIMTRGTGATGVRVDGIENRLIIPKRTEIHADGLRGNGVLIAYGRGQVVEQSGTVTAKGQGGTGIRFDFGSSSNGATDEYRGSYIRYIRSVDENTGNIISGENLPLTDMDKFIYNAAADELAGAMVERYDLSGALAGGDNAIYISKNAFVKNININAGAAIAGNITSDWKHFTMDGSYDGPKNPIADLSAEALKIQYNGYKYDYNRYIPDLVTNLNFNASMNYNGNISGADNMKLNVNRGTLNFGGAADVVNVSVANGAALYGGSFTVNDMTANMADGFSDVATGQFFNHGSIGAASADATMNINGKLVSDGVLRAYGGGGKGWIDVSGTADIDGSTASTTNTLPNETWIALKANTVNGAISNPAGKSYAATGMLNTTGEVDGNTVTVTAKASNNLGTTDATVNETYDAMIRMYNGLANAGDSRVNEMRPLFSLDAADARAALSSISNNAAAQNMGLSQTSTMTGHIVSSRLAEAFAQKPVNVKIPVANLDGDDEKSIELPMALPQPMENDFWFKAAKNWGDLKGGAYYHGTSFAIGWDRAYGPAWRGGAFVSYGTVAFADTGARNEVKDTRLGFYGGYSNGPHEGYVYLDYGWLKNDLQRSIAVLGVFPQADYDSRILELGGEYSTTFTRRRPRRGTSARISICSFPSFGRTVTRNAARAYLASG